MQLAPTLIVPVHVSFMSRKSDWLLPVTATFVTVTGTLPVFVMVVVCVGPNVPAA